MAGNHNEKFPPPPDVPSRRIGMVSTDGGSMQPIDLDTMQPPRHAQPREEPIFGPDTSVEDHFGPEAYRG